MIRKCVKYDTSRIVSEFNIKKQNDIEFYIDEKNEKQISKFLRSHRKRFRIILFHIFTNRSNSSIYGSEPYGLKAMKFKSLLNARIYCKEFFKNGKKIVLIHLLENKTFQKAKNKKIDSKLKSISEHEYNF